jgi:hypothetical protein
METRMKLLWHSVAPWTGTGYGQQTATFTPRIKGLGHDLAISAFYGLGGDESMWQGLRVLPQYNAPYGNDVLIQHALDHFGAADGELLPAAGCCGRRWSPR